MKIFIAGARSVQKLDVPVLQRMSTWKKMIVVNNSTDLDTLLKQCTPATQTLYSKLLPKPTSTEPIQTNIFDQPF